MEQAGPVNSDREDPPPLIRSDIILMICGFHVFCGTPLYCAPYALKDVGWVGLFLLYSYFGCSFIGAIEIGVLMTTQTSAFKNYAEMGQVAFGRPGKYFVTVLEFLVTHASCVESFMILRNGLEYTTPIKKLTSHQSVNVRSFFWIVVTVLLTVLCEVVDAEKYDIHLTVTGSLMSLAVAGCLTWIKLVNNIKAKPYTTSYATLPKLPIANGVFALFFTGHPYLPKLYSSLRNANLERYIKIMLGTFVPSLAVYIYTSAEGYSLFGKDVQPMFVLNMPLKYPASNVAVWSMVLHQLIRYILGIEAMTESIIPKNGRKWYLPRVILKGFLVVTTVPLTVAYKSYGLCTALVGSFLGIIVSLIVPCACNLMLRSHIMHRYELGMLIFMIFVASVTAIVGSYFSAIDLYEETGITFFGMFKKKDN